MFKRSLCKKSYRRKLSVASQVKRRAASFSKSILVVEDDPVVTQIICETLSSLGVSVLTAEDGEQAMALIDSSENEIGLVILDYVIPGIHAGRFIEHIKRARSNVKIVLTSGYPESVITEDVKRDNFDGFIPKPYEPMTLLGHLQDVMAV